MMVAQRTYGQAKEIMLFDGLEKVVRFTKTLPKTLEEASGHFIARALNRPSRTDMKVAAWLEQSVGALERAFGKTGDWDAYRVLDMAQKTNDLIYMGGIGFKPFSALRNLFQVPLLVPTDLGGPRAFKDLLFGLQRAMKQEFREEVRQMGIIAEFAPEIHMRPSPLNIGKDLVFNLRSPTMRGLRDSSMWMFQKADRWNRYWTAGAAANRWDSSLSKIGGELGPQKVNNFMRNLRVQSREPYVAEKIEDLLERGLYREARTLYIQDVVADTQYLYGVLDAPQALGKFGGVGRSAFIFQSWWMNFGSAISKWLQGGKLSDKTLNMVNFMMSSAIVEQMMEPMWGRKRALLSVGLGPFPHQFNEFMIPPAWLPIYHTMAGLSSATFDPKASERHLQGLLRAGTMFVPGGLQIKSTITETVKKGFPGFLGSMIGKKASQEE